MRDNSISNIDGLNLDGSTCDFSTLQWCKSNTHNKLDMIVDTLL